MPDIWNLLTKYMGGSPFLDRNLQNAPAQRPIIGQGASCYAIDPNTHQQLKIPPGVSIQRNVGIGQQMGSWGSPTREAGMAELFGSNEPWDYQRVYGSDGKINRDYINVGNYNYGAVAAAAGYSEDEALAAAGLVNAKNLFNPKVNKSGPLFSNPDNNKEILAGYRAYKAGTLCQST